MPPTTPRASRPLVALASMVLLAAFPSTAGAAEAPPPAAAGAGPSVVTAADLDGNGAIDEGELGQDLIDAFLDLDRDADGALDLDELGGGSPDQFAALAGEDGRLDFAEAAAAKRARFHAADADGDGALSPAEFAAAGGG